MTRLAAPLLALLAAAPILARAEAPPGPSDARHDNLDARGLALAGYDPVSYFREGGGAPRPGRADLTAEHEGARYRFASEAHRELFQATPERYEPAYGGWCAYAMALDGSKVEVDPESYVIQNGQLLLFYRTFFNNTRAKWTRRGGERFGRDADQHWQRLTGEPPHRDVRALDLREGVALGGYDPLSYRNGLPTPGLAMLALVHDGITYRFATEANRTAFRTNPAFPDLRYGGWCARNMARSKRVAADPRVFLLEGEALYLFTDALQRDEWTAGPQLRKAADAAWAKLSK